MKKTHLSLLAILLGLFSTVRAVEGAGVPRAAKGAIKEVLDLTNKRKDEIDTIIYDTISVKEFFPRKKIDDLYGTFGQVEREYVVDRLIQMIHETGNAPKDSKIYEMRDECLNTLHKIIAKNPDHCLLHSTSRQYIAEKMEPVHLLINMERKIFHSYQNNDIEGFKKMKNFLKEENICQWKNIEHIRERIMQYIEEYEEKFSKRDLAQNRISEKNYDFLELSKQSRLSLLAQEEGLEQTELTEAVVNQFFSQMNRDIFLHFLPMKTIGII